MSITAVKPVSFEFRDTGYTGSLSTLPNELILKIFFKVAKTDLQSLASVNSLTRVYAVITARSSEHTRLLPVITAICAFLGEGHEGIAYLQEGLNALKECTSMQEISRNSNALKRSISSKLPIEWVNHYTDLQSLESVFNARAELHPFRSWILTAVAKQEEFLSGKKSMLDRCTFKGDTKLIEGLEKDDPKIIAEAAAAFDKMISPEFYKNLYSIDMSLPFRIFKLYIAQEKVEALAKKLLCLEWYLIGRPHYSHDQNLIQLNAILNMGIANELALAGKLDEAEAMGRQAILDLGVTDESPNYVYQSQAITIKVLAKCLRENGLISKAQELIALLPSKGQAYLLKDY